MAKYNSAAAILLALLISAAHLAAAEDTPADNPRQFRQTPCTGLVPLSDMQTDHTYKGEDGGLYGKGQNVPPNAHADAARRELALIRPLDSEGRPSPDGKIVLMSIGMSNTRQEFAPFKDLADADPDKNPNLIVVNAAIGGMDVAAWAANRRTEWGTAWEGALRRLAEAQVTTQQVQVIWLKQARINPAASGEFPVHARRLADGIRIILQMARERYPNLRIVYLSSRIYAGHAAIPLNPEPYAYEGAFAIRWLIQDQIAGEAQLNYDAAEGTVKSPLLLWGPYLWADGVNSRSDGLTWRREDLAADGTHPSDRGAAKVANLLLDFFKTNPLAHPWYLAAASARHENAVRR